MKLKPAVIPIGCLALLSLGCVVPLDHGGPRAYNDRVDSDRGAIDLGDRALDPGSFGPEPARGRTMP